MHPRALITIDGMPVSGVFMERLISVTVNDREGVRSDSVEMELEAGPPFLAVPRTKAKIGVSIGYGAALQYFGSYTADDVDLKCIPYTMSISGKAADMRSATKQHGDKHYDDKTVKDIVGDLAKRMGVTAQVAGSIGQTKIKWFAMQGESPLHTVQRLAERVNGLAAIKDGKLIFAERGAGQTPGGAGIGKLIIMPTMIQPDSLSVKFTGRESHKKVAATYHDKDKGKREKVEVDGDKDGEATYTMRHNHANKEEAEAAAKSKAKELERQATQTNVTIEGNTAARGGAPMAYVGIHPSVDGIEFTIENAAHTFSKAGYTTAITAKKKV